MKNDGPLGSDSVELIEEQDARFRRGSSIKDISNLRNKFKKRKIRSIHTHGFFTRTDVLIQELGTFDTNEVQPTFSGNGRSKKRLATPRVAIQ